MGLMSSLSCIFLFAISTFGGIFFFNKKNSKMDEKETDHDYNNLFCRFVTDGSGRKIGESVTLDNDIMIIKAGKRFLGVPIKHIEEKGNGLLVKGLIDFDRAYELGEKWRKESFREIKQKEESEGNTDGF
jgi:hypothetical protein